jgi:hypothetical protein
MMTLFATPKAFQAHIGVIQRNALRSWTLLRPRPEILLLGDEPGTREICEEYGLRQIPDIERNPHGTPLVSSIFEKARQEATQPLLCYVNCDIILLPDLLEAAGRVVQLLPGQNFLLVGGKWDLDRFDAREFGRAGWEDRLQTHLRTHCRQGQAFEYFLFLREMRWGMPPFAIGRTCHDNWLLYRARKMGIPLIDGTPMITAVHQRHDHTHYLRRNQSPLESPEARNNLKLLGFWNNYALVDASHLLTPAELTERHLSLRRLLERGRMIAIYAHYLLRFRFYPYSYPLYLSLKMIFRILKAAFRSPQLIRELFRTRPC